MPAKTRLAQLISVEEGFGRPGKIPTTHHNPGDLRHSPHSQHAPGNPDAIGIIDTDDHGWEDLERQLALYANRGLTLREAIFDFAPPNENDSQRYLSSICLGLGMQETTPIAEALEVQAHV